VKIGRFTCGEKLQTRVPSLKMPADRRKERGARGADVRVRSTQQPLGLLHVRPSQQYFGGQACRQLHEPAHVQVEPLGQQRRVDRCPDQQRECVDVARHVSRETRGVRARGLDGGLRLAHVERGNRTQFMPLAGQVERFLPINERIACDAVQFTVRPEREIGAGDFGDERQLRRAPRRVLREVSLQLRFGKVAHAPEEIEFETGDTRRHAGFIPDRQSFATRARQGTGCGHRRHAVGALDAVLGPRPFDIEHHHAKVAIARERESDQFLELRIDEEIPPADVGNRRGRRWLTCGRPGRRQFDARARDRRQRPGGRNAGLLGRQSRHKHAASGEPRRRDGGGEDLHFTPAHGACLPTDAAPAHRTAE
jgi:hypothetical protein